MRVDYDRIAPQYDRRYAGGGTQGIRRTLEKLVQSRGAQRILEVGCGTGYWLDVLNDHRRTLFGCDLSAAMLQVARARPAHYTRARAERLPFAAQSFDVVLCVHALHHFDQPEIFVAEARRVLRAQGMLAVIGMNPLAGNDCWYLYDYFPGTYERDIERYPSAGDVTNWLIAAGFQRTEWFQAARVIDTRVGRAVLNDPILDRNGTSQLSLLSDDEFRRGMSQIETELRQAEAEGATLVFPVDIGIMLVAGYAREAIVAASESPT